jgi:hypothetical protein
VGPDGNLWFTLSKNDILEPSEILRITSRGAIAEVRLSTRNASPGDPTVGPDGNLWFPQESTDGSKPGAIGRISLSPGVTKTDAVADSRGAIGSILVYFDKAMKPASVGKADHYALASGVVRGQTIVYTKRVKIARVSYDRATHTVRLKLAVPQKRPIQVTVRAGIVATNGMKSSSDYTAVVM